MQREHNDARLEIAVNRLYIKKNKTFKDVLFGKTNQKSTIESFISEFSAESKIQYPAYLYK